MIYFHEVIFLNVLAFDTSGSWLTVALSMDGNFKFIQSLSKSRQVDMLVMEIDDLINSTGNSISDINLIGCVIGPGNFTGLRSGIAVAKALSFSLSIPIIGLKYFECLETDKPIALVRSARKGWWYVSTFDGIVWTSDMLPSEALSEIKVKILSEEKLENISSHVNDGPLFSGYALLESTTRSFGRFENIYDHVNVKPFYLQKPIAQQIAEDETHEIRR